MTDGSEASVARTLFLQAETDLAVLVSSSPVRADADLIGAWLPRSQIKITDDRVAYNPRFGEAPQVCLLWGRVVTFTAPSWLIAAKNLTEDAPVQEKDFECPPHGRCAHGTPRNNHCDACAGVRKEARA